MFHLIRNFTKLFSTFEAPIRELPGSELIASLDEYSRASSLIQAKNYVMAELELSRCMDILNKANLKTEPGYSFLLHKLALVQRLQQKFSQCENSLETIVKNYEQNPKNYQIPLQQAYKTLFIQYLAQNIDKALKLAESLSLSNNYNSMTKEFQQEVKFIYGTALILHGQDFSKAKSLLNECLNMDLDINTPIILHNLACAQWLHSKKYYGIDTRNLSTEERQDYNDYIENYNKAILNFQKAIQIYEGLSDIFTLNSGFVLKNKLSGLSLTNIGEIFIENNDFEKAVDWVKTAMKLYEDTDKENIGRALVLIGSVLKEKKHLMHAEGLIRNAMEIMKGRNDGNEVFALRMYGALLKSNTKRFRECEDVQKKAQGIADILPYWYERAVYLYVPKWVE
ncbi:hypothetical protein SteCoe_10681 [Stentor coeruleus]|uniref:Uncharacterized protein n=1 Tax=Stentor coeruleus TaxID=5963 RepID=A0A1R2CF70_9CILI|nr:hypothetical protein SteCoe_10681 [Stentor coeruleus]